MKTLAIIIVLLLSGAVNAQENTVGLSVGYELPQSSNYYGHNFGVEYSKGIKKDSRWKLDYGIYINRYALKPVDRDVLPPAVDSSDNLSLMENAILIGDNRMSARLYVGASYDLIKKSKFYLSVGGDIIGNVSFWEKRSVRKNEVYQEHTPYYHFTGKTIDVHSIQKRLDTETFFAPKLKLGYRVSPKISITAQYRQVFHFIDYSDVQLNAGIAYHW